MHIILLNETYEYGIFTTGKEQALDVQLILCIAKMTLKSCVSF